MQIDQLNILALGRNPEILLVMNRLLNAPPKWHGVTVSTPEEALAAFARESFHIVLLCSGICPEEEAGLTAQLLLLNPAVIVKRHYGGGSGLLKNEIQFVLDRENIQLAP
ncbi:hypothetical protein SAMN05518672_103122 [Chitinophaga sp. CF118]|uniref:hypothetical protein n=1 Tax=Chitinophaga sp. CF118 TaxID=1884367 RepID=UPI0008DF7396|nr:hypothetical protein [Chitinophaga sp. CF118]SFD76376.1 hypothetical protein SAMN05518672_103122 [Chitinophaga sp. CF118]